jgi:hypothetical protein
MTVDRRLLLYARKAQTQCPRRWLMASTPLASAVWPHRQPFHHAHQRVTTQRLTPSPPFASVSKVRTLQTKVSCVALVNPRLEALCRSGVPAGCPVFSGLQTGSCSGPPPAGSAFVLWGQHDLSRVAPFYSVEHYRYALRRAPMPPCGVPVSVSSTLPRCITPARRNFQRRSLISLSATRFFTALINLRCRIVSK